jgi:hypothetical protein
VEEYTRSAEVTTYPIETGAILSDHYQPQPRKISLVGAVSDTPSGPWTNIEGLKNAAPPPQMSTRRLVLENRSDPLRQLGPRGILRPIATGPLPSQRLIRANIDRARLYAPDAAQTLQVTPGSNGETGPEQARIAAFAAVLDALMDQRLPVSVVLTTGAEYTDMMIVDLRAPRLAGSGGLVRFAIDLQQIVQSEAAATAPTRDEPAIKQKKAKGRRGKSKPSKYEIALANGTPPLTEFFPVP